MTNYGFGPLAGPEVHIGVNKSRQKVYTSDGIDTIFMYDDQEFQLEFFNPTQQTVLAKISMNGSPISHKGLVLRPGERAWLDRNLDNPNKFKFSTYAVENTPESKLATANNGMIRVDFYYEKTPTYIPNYQQPYYYTTGFTSDTTRGFSNTTTTTNTYFSSSVDFESKGSNLKSMGIKAKASSVPKTEATLDFMETGRIEKGSYSDQKFNTVDIDFNQWISKTVTYKLVPISQKQTVTVNEIKVHCGKCGKKTKKDDNYCRKCGNKL